MEYMLLLINILFGMALVSGVIMTMVGLPGNILIVLGAMAYGYYDHFQHVDYSMLLIIGGVFIVSEIFDFLAGVLGAKKEKASKRAILAAFIGTVAGGIGGTAILPVIGSIGGALLGAFVGAALAEYTKIKDKEQAKRVAIGVLKGQIMGMVIKTTTAIGMVITLLYQMKWH